MLKYLLIFLLFTGNIFAMEPIKLILENDNNERLNLYLLNVSKEKVLINKRFSLDNYVNPSELAFTIIDEKGLELPFVSRVRITQIAVCDIIFIKPDERVGVQFEIDELVQDYCLKPGQYKVQAMYQNFHMLEKGVFSNLLISDWITFKVDDGKGVNWECP